MKSLVITIDKIDVDEMLKHRALKSEKGAKFCGNHHTDCIIQQLDQNKKILLYFFFFDFGALCVHEVYLQVHAIHFH